MAISAADVSVATNGDIRWTGNDTTFYTVLELHRFLGDLADDEQASGDDLVDITTDTPSDRSTDQIITLNAPFNIDATMARHLYDGSVSQNGGDDLFSGLRVLGSVVAGTEIVIIQDDKVLPAFWGTGINADAANSVIMRLLIQTRSGGADIDGKRILCMARELGDQFKEFPVTMGLANSVAAISTAADLNNATAENTIRGWTTIANVEGFQLIDINGDTTDEEYYAQFDKGSQSLNDTYEWSKLQTARSLETLAGTDTGSDFIVDNATIVGQAQSFTTNAVIEKLTEARFTLKIGAGAPTGPLTAELYASTTGVIPTGAVLATSEEVLSSLITSTYQEVIFRFNDNYSMAASTQYCIVIRHPTGTAGDYFHVQGSLAGGTVAGENNANENPASTWNAVAAADLTFTVKACPVWHGRPGEKFRGITHEIVYDTGVGTFTEDEVIFWGTDVTYDTLSGTFTVGEYVTFDNAGTIVNGGKVLEDSGTILRVALEDITGATLADGYTITGLDSGATADINTTITNQDKAGGEGVLLALDDNTGTGDFYIQLISGSAPVDNLPIKGRSSSATAAVNVTVTPRTVSPEFIGASTGTNLIGAYGIGFQTTDVGASDKFFDLTNTQRTPPNNVTFTVTGLVSGEDRVLVGPRSGSTLVKNQLTTDTTLSGATETLVQCSAAIPTDTPTSGTGADNTRLRVELDTGVYRIVQYDSYSGNDFTITTADDDWTGGNVSTAPKDVFVAYIDVLADATTEAYTAVYVSDRDILVRVRDGGGTPIKTFEGEGVFGSTSSSLAAIRTSDA
jgi:hypothetical protein